MVCGSNLRQVPIGLGGYMSDRDDWMPPYVTYHSQRRSVVGPDGVRYNQYRRMWTHTEWFRSGDFLDPIRYGDGHLAEYMGTDTGHHYGVLGCPAQPDGNKMLTHHGLAFRSIVQHRKSLGVNLYATTWYEDLGRAKPRHSDDADNPVEFVIYGDTSGKASYMARPDQNQRWEDYTASAPTPRHFDKFNAAFMDGHVTRGTMDKLYVTKHFVP